MFLPVVGGDQSWAQRIATCLLDVLKGKCFLRSLANQLKMLWYHSVVFAAYFYFKDVVNAGFKSVNWCKWSCLCCHILVNTVHGHFTSSVVRVSAHAGQKQCQNHRPVRGHRAFVSQATLFIDGFLAVKQKVFQKQLTNPNFNNYN